MKLSFSTSESVKNTNCFEECYEPELQCEEAERVNLLLKGRCSWLKRGGELVGEVITIMPSELGEDIEDVTKQYMRYPYWYSTTVLPKYQGRGYARLLIAFHIGRLMQSNVKAVTGHATTPAMAHIRQTFGAEMVCSHENWYGTERTAYFYVQQL